MSAYKQRAPKSLKPQQKQVASGQVGQKSKKSPKSGDSVVTTLSLPDDSAVTRAESVAKSNNAKEYTGSALEYEKDQNSNNPKPHIPSNELSSEQQQLAAAAHQKPLTAGEVSEALMPKVASVRAIVTAITNALWSLRTASGSQVVSLVQSMRDGCDKWLHVNQSSRSFQSVASTSMRVSFCMDTPEQVACRDPQIRCAYEKLLNAQIKYEQKRGGGSRNVEQWVIDELVLKGVLTIDEVQVVPAWMIRNASSTLYTAIYNANRPCK